MVSNFRYFSFKQLDVQGRVSFLLAVVVMLVIALILIQPPIVLFLGFFAYAVSGPVWTLLRLRERRAGRRPRRPAGGT
ncbi:MAG TPA: CDP-diacylglycerol--serine O-phosphatidyltransferase, partial [Lamprocystis sp. (in: g-proteobacteria)]|nr:CDP-diacylglycerol--serine O-phosphatidyltransferase [Lamprocystis sp. (in: g-proteobacteria)]